ncbi:MAG: 50S ribosomal protein L10 [Bacteroidia bacterium]
MTKEQKIQLVKELTETFKTYPNFYIADTGGLTVEEVNNLRGKCFENNVKMQVVKNTLIKKALLNMEDDFDEVDPALKQTSALFFVDAENPSVPAKILKEYRGKEEVPRLKAAVIDSAVFLGDDQLESLTNLKSKAELIGEVVGLLQSPAKNVISALKSGGSTIAGLIKALEERAA